MILYLLGFPGVGKKTIATEICSTYGFTLYDNHAVNNAVFPFVRTDGKTKMPEEVWKSIRQIRNIAFNTLIDIGNKDRNYVFTNCLFQGDEEDHRIYKLVENLANKINTVFVPVRLICDVGENKNRIIQPDRDEYYKTTRASLIDELQAHETIKPDHENSFTIDVTNISAREAADKIYKNIYKYS